MSNNSLRRRIEALERRSPSPDALDAITDRDILRVYGEFLHDATDRELDLLALTCASGDEWTPEELRVCESVFATIAERQAAAGKGNKRNGHRV